MGKAVASLASAESSYDPNRRDSAKRKANVSLAETSNKGSSIKLSLRESDNTLRFSVTGYRACRKGERADFGEDLDAGKYGMKRDTVHLEADILALVTMLEVSGNEIISKQSIGARGMIAQKLFTLAQAFEKETKIPV